jgi:pilus assembly protein CpaB
MENPDPGRARRLRRRARRVAWRYRFVFVALCCGLAATAVVQALRPPPPPTTDVVVTTHLLAAGEEVQPDDVAVEAVPAALAPDGALRDPDEAVGRVPALTLPAGLPLHAELVSGGAAISQAPEGTVVVPVRLDDAAAGWLRPGDRVDLLAAGGAGSSLEASGPAFLARRALVLPGMPVAGAAADGGAGGLLGGTGGASRDGPVTLVAVTPDEAPALSAASGWGTVGAVLVR